MDIPYLLTELCGESSQPDWDNLLPKLRSWFPCTSPGIITSSIVLTQSELIALRDWESRPNTRTRCLTDILDKFGYVDLRWTHLSQYMSSIEHDILDRCLLVLKTHFPDWHSLHLLIQYDQTERYLQSKSPPNGLPDTEQYIELFHLLGTVRERITHLFKFYRLYVSLIKQLEQKRVGVEPPTVLP
jgi:hypothetical protein